MPAPPDYESQAPNRPKTIWARLSSPADAFGHNAYSDVDNRYDHYKICAGQKPSGKRKEVGWDEYREFFCRLDGPGLGRPLPLGLSAL